MAKTITSRPSIFGWTNHYDEHGKKIGESRPSIFGGMNHYDASGKKVGHSYPGVISDEVHYDNHGHRVRLNSFDLSSCMKKTKKDYPLLLADSVDQVSKTIWKIFFQKSIDKN
jgi:hypothetical protein